MFVDQISGNAAKSAAFLFGLSAEDITALGTVGLAFATLLLAAAAWRQLPILIRQLRLLSQQIKESREATQAADQRQREMVTLDVCRKAETEPTIVDCSRRIWDASDGGANYKTGKIKRHDLIIMLNYIDGVAVGIKQGVYLETMVKDHMGLLFRKVVEEIFPSAVIDSEGYEAIIEVHGKWYPPKAARAHVEYDPSKNA